jgi:hypothetical protein
VNGGIEGGVGAGGGGGGASGGGAAGAVAPSPLTAAAFSPDGRTVALARGAVVSTFVGAREPRVQLTAAGPVSGLAFSPDGSRLLVASEAADQWVFLPLGDGRVSAVTVRGFPRLGGWCCAALPSRTLSGAYLADGRYITLRWTRDAAGACLEIVGIDDWTRACGRPPSAREDLVAGPTAQRSPTAPREVYGVTSAAVDRVVVRYSVGGQRLRADAVLLRAESPLQLRRAGIASPFGYYLALLPADASHVTAVALGASGKRRSKGGYRAFRDLDPHAFLSSR